MVHKTNDLSTWMKQNANITIDENYNEYITNFHLYNKWNITNF